VKINPDSPNAPDRLDPATAPARTEKAFGDTLAANVRQSAGLSDAKPLAGVAGAFSKAEVGDPAKADSIVGRAVHEIVNREFGKMCPPDRELVAAWLGSDPIVREALLKHITSLAS